MADAPAFEVACEALEQGTDLDRLQARGTVRIALKQAGLDPASVSGAQMTVVVDKLLPGELEGRGIRDAAGVCAGLRQRLAGLASNAATASGDDTPEAIFARLAGR